VRRSRLLMSMATRRTFTQPWDLSDVSFAVEGRYIYANKTIMSMWSRRSCPCGQDHHVHVMWSRPSCPCPCGQDHHVHVVKTIMSMWSRPSCPCPCGQDHHVHVVKTIMSMWSPVLKAMFGGAFRESEAAVVELPGKQYNDLLELICVLHPPNKPIDGELSENTHLVVERTKTSAPERQIRHLTPCRRLFIISGPLC